MHLKVSLLFSVSLFSSTSWFADHVWNPKNREAKTNIAIFKCTVLEGYSELEARTGTKITARACSFYVSLFFLLGEHTFLEFSNHCQWMVPKTNFVSSQFHEYPTKIQEKSDKYWKSDPMQKILSQDGWGVYALQFWWESAGKLILQPTGKLYPGHGHTYRCSALLQFGVHRLHIRAARAAVMLTLVRLW